MCLIVDVNIAPKVLLPINDADFKHVQERLFAMHGLTATLVYGGHLKVEYERIQSIWPFLRRLDQMGRVRIVDSSLVEAEQEQVLALGLCCSDDPHIIALARVSNVRLLCSEDGDLAADFTNKDLIDEPRGKVYKKAAHRHLIAEFCQSQ